MDNELSGIWGSIMVLPINEEFKRLLISKSIDRQDEWTAKSDDAVIIIIYIASYHRKTFNQNEKSCWGQLLCFAFEYTQFAGTIQFML